jgi:hypothetical protein
LPVPLLPANGVPLKYPPGSRRSEESVASFSGSIQIKKGTCFTPPGPTSYMSLVT